MRIGSASAVAVLFCVCLVVSGCHALGLGSDDNPAAPSGPPKSGSNVTYAVLGASDAVGVGSSHPCLPWEDCNGTGYAWVAARQLRSLGFSVSVKQLGLPAAVISRTFQELAVRSGRSDVILNFIDSEMPFVDPDATVVTIFAGANDVNIITDALDAGLGGTDSAAFIDQKVDQFGADYSTLLNGVRGRAKNAQIIVMNLPNLAGLPYLAKSTLAQKRAAQRAAVRMTTNVVNRLPNIRIVDLMCNARLYQQSLYSSDGFHPNDSGYGIIGAELVTAVTAASYPSPQTSCSQMTLY